MFSKSPQGPSVFSDLEDEARVGVVGRVNHVFVIATNSFFNTKEFEFVQFKSSGVGVRKRFWVCGDDFGCAATILFWRAAVRKELLGTVEKHPDFKTKMSPLLNKFQ